MPQLTDNAARSRFEMVEQGMTVWADYRRQGDTLIIDHVEAPPPLRGTGAAGRIMQGLVEAARAEGRRIVPLCGYAAAWLRRHPDV